MRGHWEWVPPYILYPGYFICLTVAHEYQYDITFLLRICLMLNCAEVKNYHPASNYTELQLFPSNALVKVNYSQDLSQALAFWSSGFCLSYCHSLFLISRAKLHNFTAQLNSTAAMKFLLISHRERSTHYFLHSSHSTDFASLISLGISPISATSGVMADSSMCN